MPVGDSQNSMFSFGVSAWAGVAPGSWEALFTTEVGQASNLDRGMGIEENSASQESSNSQAEPLVQRLRLNEEGDAAPGSQDTSLAFRADQALSLRESTASVAVARAHRFFAPRLVHTCCFCDAQSRTQEG